MITLLSLLTAFGLTRPPCCGGTASPAPAATATAPRSAVRARPALPLGWTVGLELGAGLPGRLRLLDQEVRSAAFVGSVACGYAGRLRGPLLYEVAVEASAMRRRGRIGVRELALHTANVGVGGALGLELPDGGWGLYAGASVRNQNLFAEFDARRDDNLRVDARLRLRGAVGGRVALTAGLAHALPRAGDASAVLDPNARASLGATWTLPSRG